jgi:hypothetical protein
VRSGFTAGSISAMTSKVLPAMHEPTDPDPDPVGEVASLRW